MKTLRERAVDAYERRYDHGTDREIELFIEGWLAAHRAPKRRRRFDRKIRSRNGLLAGQRHRWSMKHDWRTRIRSHYRKGESEVTLCGLKPHPNGKPRNLTARESKVTCAGCRRSLGSYARLRAMNVWNAKTKRYENTVS